MIVNRISDQSQGPYVGEDPPRDSVNLETISQIASKNIATNQEAPSEPLSFSGNIPNPYLLDSCKITRKRFLRNHEKKEEPKVEVDRKNTEEEQKTEPKEWSLVEVVSNFFFSVLSDFRGL
jgi:hypothetical protein